MAIYWFKYGGKNYSGGGWGQSATLPSKSIGTNWTLYTTISVTPNGWPSKILLEKSTPNCIYLDLIVTNISNS